jgi:hypothetical protein
MARVPVRSFALAVLALGSLAGAGCQRHLYAPAFDIQKYTPVAMLEFRGDRDLGAKLADAVLADVYRNRNRYREEAPGEEVDVSWTPPAVEFVERAQLEHVLTEQDFGATDRVEVSTAPKIGAVCGAKAVVFGAIEEFSVRENPGEATDRRDAVKGTQFRAEVHGFLRATYRIVDAQDARILYVGEATAEVADSATFYPEKGEGPPRLKDRAAVRALLIQQAANRIGRAFYYKFL